MTNWFTMSIEEVRAALSTNLERGLDQAEAGKRLEKNGYNELAARSRTTLLDIILNQFKDFLVLILIFAGIISLIVGEISDALVILLIVVVNAALGASQERQAGKALEALKKMSSPKAAVLRDGRTVELPSKELVTGDIVFIETGDFIPADLRLMETVNLKIDESSLTGESVSSEKTADELVPDGAGVGDRVNSAFMGTIATYGRGKGIVTDTGMSTQIGKIAEMIETYEEGSTPLQKKLASFGKILGLIAIGVIAVVFVVGLLRKEPVLDIFMISVSLAVAAIPEGLPAIVTIVLALGMKRMVGRHAIVKRLHAVETLGSVTTICSDKTGTLTKNEMTVTIVHAGGRTLNVEGSGYAPEGRFIEDGRPEDPKEIPEMRLLFTCCILNNDSKLEHDAVGSWSIIGDPTEGALITAAQKAGIDPEAVRRDQRRLKEIPFDSDRKMMTTYHAQSERKDRFVVFTKGAPDSIIPRCTRISEGGTVREITEGDRDDIISFNTHLADKAVRVLACAFRETEKIPDKPEALTDEGDLVFLGLVGMIDPPRPEAIEAVKTARGAGIRPVMITGDHKGTAVAIARVIGIIESGEAAVTGTDLNEMNDETLTRTVRSVSVYARVSPEHKVRIVDALKANGEIVSMTGDGVNDAPSLKRADIGVAMGITGTDVAKETADMILTDDNFASIVSAVEEGRIIYGNIRKFIFFLLSCNIAEILIIFLAMVSGLPIPLEPIQILWLNLITDAFPALALGLEHAESGIMKRKPRKPTEPIIDWRMKTGIIVQSISLTSAVLGIFVLHLARSNDTEAARNFAFVTLVLAELLRSYTARSETRSLFSMKFFGNPYIVGGTLISFVLVLIVLYLPVLQPVFSTLPLSGPDWLQVLAFACIPSIAAELTKPFIRYAERRIRLRE